MRLVSLLLTVPITTCGGGHDTAQVGGFAPEIGMLAVQSPLQRQIEGTAGATRLTPVSPTDVVRASGVSWVRAALLNQMQRDPVSGDWTFPADPYLAELKESGVKIFGSISFSTWVESTAERLPFGAEPTPVIEARWLEELKALVTHHRGTVWIWQVGNEVEKEPFSLESYIRLFESGARSIREIDPGVPIAAAGFSSGDFEQFIAETWPALLACQTPPDVVDFHFHKYAGQAGLFDTQLAELVEQRNEALPAARLIVTENSTFTGTDVPYPWEDDRKITQSEVDQAAEQVKRTAIALGHGVSVSFGTDMDKLRWKDEDVHPFTHNGLVYNPRRTYETAPSVRTWPKSAWYSLRLMTELLARHDPIAASHSVIDEPPASRIDLVTFRSHEPLFLAWSDAGDGGLVALPVPGIEAPKACVTEAVLPDVGTFRSGPVGIENGRVTLRLSATPVWIGGCP